jgi:hypothetical protein
MIKSLIAGKDLADLPVGERTVHAQAQLATGIFKLAALALAETALVIDLKLANWSR